MAITSTTLDSFDDDERIIVESERYIPPVITGKLVNAALSYKAALRYTGLLYGHPGHGEGRVVTTDIIVKSHRLVETMSGTFYLLSEE